MNAPPLDRAHTRLRVAVAEEEDAGVVPEEPQFGQERGVLLGFLRGRLRGLLVLQTQPLDLLEDLPERVSQSISTHNIRVSSVVGISPFKRMYLTLS